MIQITKIIEWDMGHRVPNHKSKCRNPHGHRYRMELTISGPLIDTDGNSSEGMVFDFGDIKRIMTERVHDILDHGFMIYENDWEMKDSLANDTWKVIVVDFIPTAENISKWCYEQMKDEFPTGITIQRVRIFETPNSWADYIPK